LARHCIDLHVQSYIVLYRPFVPFVRRCASYIPVCRNRSHSFITLAKPRPPAPMTPSVKCWRLFLVLIAARCWIRAFTSTEPCTSSLASLPICFWTLPTRRRRPSTVREQCRYAYSLQRRYLTPTSSVIERIGHDWWRVPPPPVRSVSPGNDNFPRPSLNPRNCAIFRRDVQSP